MKFEWDQHKADANVKKHNVSFENAATAFSDQHSLSLYDEKHSELEDRWITLGKAKNGDIVTIVHTYRKIESIETIRIISARKATKNEIQQYITMKQG